MKLADICKELQNCFIKVRHFIFVDDQELLKDALDRIREYEGTGDISLKRGGFYGKIGYVKNDFRLNFTLPTVESSPLNRRYVDFLV